MGRLAPAGLLGIHLNLLKPTLVGPPRAEPSSRTCRPRQRSPPCDRRWLLPGAGDPPGDDRLRPAGFTGRPGSLDDRPRYRQLPEDLPRFSRRPTFGPSHPGTHRRQHHAVLADRHRGLGCALVLGEGQAEPERPDRLLRRSRSRSASPSSPGRSSEPRAAGSRRPTPPSPTSTRPTGAATSPLGRNRSSSRPRSARASGRFASRPHAREGMIPAEGLDAQVLVPHPAGDIQKGTL